MFIKHHQLSMFIYLITLCFSLLIFQNNVAANELNNANTTPYQGTDWTLNNTQDVAITLSDYQGQPVILVFWATWCPYCKKLLPGIEKLHNKYSDKGLTVIAVNIKEDWQPKTYWRNHQYHFDSVLEGDSVAELYGVKGTPAVVFIDPNGKVLKTDYFSDPEQPILEQFAQHYLIKEP